MSESGSLTAVRPIAGPRIADTLPRELRWTARLGAPLALGELGWMSTYIVDALMIGRLPHSALSISASSLGNTIFYAAVFCAIRLMTGVDTLVAQSYGAGDYEGCQSSLGQSFWFVAIGTPLVMLITLGALHVLPFFGTPPDILAETSRYLHALVWSTAPLLAYMALRFYLQGMDRVLLVMLSLLTSAAVNWLGDWALLYGHLGARPMGIAGSGWATCLVRLYMFVFLVLGVWLTRGKSPVHFTREVLIPRIDRLRLLLRIGWPAALNSITDLGISTCLSVLCARLGARLLAAHQVVLDLDAVVYMVPLGISGATIVRVGQAAGRNNVSQVRRSATASVILAVGYISIASCLFAGFPHTWARLYTNDPSVVAAAAPLFLLCGVLQIGDAAGVIYACALTGLGETRLPMLINAGWCWVLGLPASYWLAFHTALSVRGLWIGRAISALGSAAHLAIVWHAKMRTARSRLQPISLSPAVHERPQRKAG